MRAVPPPPDAAPPSVARIAEGWRYARGRQDLMGTYLVDINAMLFAMPVALFPAVADRFGGAEVLGLLFAAGPAGALLLTLTSGWTARVTRHGRAVAVSAALGGAAVAGFGFAGSLPLALAVPRRRRRGRHVLGHLPRDDVEPDDPGQPARPARRDRAALLLDRPDARHRPVRARSRRSTSVRTSLVAGGVLCVAGTAVLCALLPRFWSYDPPRH